MNETRNDPAATLDTDSAGRIDAFWRACNYLAAGMIYLRDNPLLEEPLRPEHIKQRLLGHWGASPALSFTWVHLNRLIKDNDLNMIYVIRPGHGGPGEVQHVEHVPAGQGREGLLDLRVELIEGLRRDLQRLVRARGEGLGHPLLQVGQDRLGLGHAQLS